MSQAIEKIRCQYQFRNDRNRREVERVKMEGTQTKVGIMKERCLAAVRIAVFVMLLGVTVWGISKTLMIKSYDDGHDINTIRFSRFYQMRRNTTDVLLLGSSHTLSSMSPQFMYENYGIRSYNLASSGQNLSTSYYLLLEALKTQSPKAVVLDTYYAFFLDENDMNLHYVTDGIKSIRSKIDMSKAQLGEEIYNEQASEYIFTPSRYHERYKNLSENDLTWLEKEYWHDDGLKGFGLRNTQCHYADFVPYTISDTSTTSFNETAYEYLDKITALCKEKGIELILVKTPTLFMTPAHHNSVQNYADANGLRFYDFNEQSLYESIDFNYALDMGDSSTEGYKNAHANIQGAYKITDYIGSVLSTEYGFEPVYDEQYEETRGYMDWIYDDFLLHNEQDYLSYLERLDDGDYTVFISTNGDATHYYSNDVAESLSSLGLSYEDHGADGYLAVVSAGEVLEESAGNQEESIMGSYRSGRDIYQINAGNQPTVIINRAEKSRKQPGINIVVYSNTRRIVIDSVTIDLGGKTPVLSR